MMHRNTRVYTHERCEGKVASMRWIENTGDDLHNSGEAEHKIRFGGPYTETVATRLEEGLTHASHFWHIKR